MQFAWCVMYACITPCEIFENSPFAGFRTLSRDSGESAESGEMVSILFGTNNGLRDCRFPAPPATTSTLLSPVCLGRFARELASGVAEVIWATRCIICDRPGKVLCDRCRLQLPYIDPWLACPRCGSPHGLRQCVDCNTFSLGEVGRNSVPFERCISVIEHRGLARNIITGYKDAGERRLSADIAHMVSDALPHSWKSANTVLTFVPADRLARRRRGFDHMALVAEELARQTGLPCARLLQKLPVADQRGLTRRERFANMGGSIRAAAQATASAGKRVLLIDDVFTTGATLFAACDALHAAGIRQVQCATFARVP